MKRMTQSGFGFWKIVLITIVTVLFFAAFTAVVNAADTYVPDDYGTIQDLAESMPKKTPTGFFYPTGKEPKYDPPVAYGYDGACKYYEYAGWLARGDKGDYLSGRYHIGQDIEANEGDSVFAIADGVVTSISSSGWGTGNIGVVVKHKLDDETEFLALYGHIKSSVSLNDRVDGGKSFATIGPFDSIPHLHFGIHPGLTMPQTRWGRMPLTSWPDPNAYLGDPNGPDTNGFEDPIEWITTKTPQRPLKIIAPSDGFTIEGAFDVTFKITNTGSEEMVFAKGDRSNRINLDITYEDAYFQVHYWSTTREGFTLAPGESFTKTVKCEVGVYEGDMTITLAHWERYEHGYRVGPLGMSEISGTIVHSPGTGSPVVGFYGSAALYSGLADYLESFGYLVKYVNRSNFTTVDMVYLDYRSSPLSLPSEGDLLNYVNTGGNLWIFGEAGGSETNFLGATISDSSIYFGGGEDDPSRLWLREHPLTHGVSLITYPWGAWVETGGSIEDIIRIDNHAILAVDESHQGKILWLIDVDIFGYYWLYDSDNEILAKNIADWLCGVTEKQPPIASFDYSWATFPESPKSGEVITFDASSSEGTIVSYQWDFGDGETAEGRFVTHRFRGCPSGLGTYHVTLTVEDDIGATATDTKHLIIEPLEKPVEYKPFVVAVANMKVRYNWVDEINGEDVYIISNIHTYSIGFLGIHQVSITKDTCQIWSDVLITTGANEVSYVSPFTPTNEIFGASPQITTKTFPDGTFEGIEVHTSDKMNLVVFGATTLGLDGGEATTAFDPNAPVEYPLEPYKSMPVGEALMALFNSPGELRVYDSQGRVTGIVNGEAREEIPDSAYFNNTVVILSPSDSYRYEVAGTEDGSYGLVLAFVEDGEATTFTAIDISIASGAIHQYTIDWDALSQGDKGVTVLIDSDGDGIFEQTITTDDTFQLPIASFTYTPENPVVDETITFNASGSYDPDGTITKYEWNFGNGDIIDTTEPIITHFYALAGDYTVNLMVTDDDGGTGDYAAEVTVISAEEATEIIIDQLEVSVSIVPPEAPEGVSQKIESAIDKLEQVIDFLGQGKYCDAIGKLDGVIIQIEGAIDQVNEQRCSIKECKGKECICIADDDANELIKCLEQAKEGAIAIRDLISAEHPECA